MKKIIYASLAIMLGASCIGETKGAANVPPTVARELTESNMSFLCNVIERDSRYALLAQDILDEAESNNNMISSEWQARLTLIENNVSPTPVAAVDNSDGMSPGRGLKVTLTEAHAFEWWKDLSKDDRYSLLVLHPKTLVKLDELSESIREEVIKQMTAFKDKSDAEKKQALELRGYLLLCSALQTIN